MNVKTLLTCSAVLFFAATVHADVKLPFVFSDHMVLQADMAAPVFGTAAAGEQVTVEINGQKKTATADKDGKWLAKLDAMKAGGPYELKVTGKNAITIKDVLVGEVWMASGQSNMRFPLSRATDGAAEISAMNNPKIRYLQDTGSWVFVTPNSGKNFSAAAYYFAKDLQEHLKVPVGIIENSVSGACIEQFISPEELAKPDIAEAIKLHDVPRHDVYDASIAPLIPYGIKGALWYQGEGNRDFPITYRKLLATLAADWRARWGQGNFPLIIVQLANWHPQTPEPSVGKDCTLREAQLKALTAIPATALVVTIDLGIVNDVHYPNKKPVGDRLSIAARGMVYGEKIEYSGPIFDAVKFEGAKAVVSFKHVGGGLVAKGDALKGFVICGADKKFVRADAKIEGDTVVVTQAGVTSPIAVRYAFENNPVCTLTNKEGLPAAPFRSDEFVSFPTRDNTADDK